MTAPLRQELTPSTNTNERLQFAYLPSPQDCSSREREAHLIDLCTLGGWHSTWPAEEKDGYPNENLSPVGNKDIKTRSDPKSRCSGTIRDTGMELAATNIFKNIMKQSKEASHSRTVRGSGHDN